MPQVEYRTRYNSAPTSNPIHTNLWENYGNINLIGTSYVECTGPDNLAEDVVLKFLGSQYLAAGAGNIGGSLYNLDIKRMDARTVLNLSLIEYSARQGSGFYEAIVNGDGQVDFVEIGGGGVSADIEDQYYVTQTISYKDDAVAVMVYGGRPLPERRELTWKPIWGDDGAVIYTMQDMLGNCHKENFSRYATIAFKDPQLDTAYLDGIDNFYDIGRDNPWDTLIGYVKYKEPPQEYVGPYTKIDYSNRTKIPINIGGVGVNGPYMGNLLDLPTFDTDGLLQAECWSTGSNETLSIDDGVEVVIPDEFRFTTVRETVKDNFIGVSEVFLVGIDIDVLMSMPFADSDAVNEQTTDNSFLLASVQTQKKTTRRLTPGREYVIAYDGPDEGPKTPYIIFTKDVRPTDAHAYGQDTVFYYDPTCEYVRQNSIDYDSAHTATIFPYSKTKGMIVTEMWVYVDMETPSIVIEDPGTPDDNDANALQIAQDLKYYLAPIVMIERPAPIGYTSSTQGPKIIDQEPIHDNDPTTTQDFAVTELEEAFDEMQGGGMTVTYSFLSDPDYEESERLVRNMSETLYNYMNMDGRTVTETIYTCGPNCNPNLGGRDNEAGGIVNSIVYSYSDQGSYTVSVHVGPYVIGNLSQADGGPTEKMSGDYGAAGTVIDSVGDGINFKVRVDGFGERWAVSTTYKLVRIGDRVNCTVHNCPIES